MRTFFLVVILLTSKSVLVIFQISPSIFPPCPLFPNYVGRRLIIQPPRSDPRIMLQSFALFVRAQPQPVVGTSEVFVNLDHPRPNSSTGCRLSARKPRLVGFLLRRNKLLQISQIDWFLTPSGPPVTWVQFVWGEVTLASPQYQVNYTGTLVRWSGQYQVRRYTGHTCTVANIRWDTLVTLIQYPISGEEMHWVH